MSIVIKRFYCKPDAKLGSCCNCGSTENVWTMVTLARRGIGNVGWGCSACGLPPEGALATLCDKCAFDEPVNVCVGPAMYDEHKAVSELSSDEFNHKPDCEYKNLSGLGRFTNLPELTDRSKGLPR